MPNILGIKDYGRLIPSTGQIFPTGTFANLVLAMDSTIEEIELDSSTADTWTVE